MRHVQGRAGECHIVARTTRQDKVRELQRTLYRAAKADPGRRFHALYDKIYRRDVLEHAWELVRANRGAAGIDRQTIADVERYGVSRLLDELAADLKDGRWRPLPARRVFIPKPGRPQERRPLSIPAVRDRVVQAATKTVIEPIFEADMLECSFGFRPRRSTHDALQVLIDEAWRGRRWVAESDIANCFEAIPHSGLMSAIEERISDRHVLKLLRAMLRAGVMIDGAIARGDSGTPQGGVLSPCLANVYLHRLDRQWADRGTGVLVRYADDLLAMCRTRPEAERALASLTAILAELGLELKQAKTRIVHLTEGGEGLDFLGFHHRWVRGNTPRSRHLCFLARWPHGRPPSAPATGFGRSPTEAGCWYPSKTSRRTSTGSCAAGRATSATETPTAPSTRSTTTRWTASRGSWANATTRLGVRHEGRRLPVAEPPRADQPQRNHRRATPQPAVATGTLNAHR
jgi:group II intron reverse transcriptase/maturase